MERLSKSADGGKMYKYNYFKKKTNKKYVYYVLVLQRSILNFKKRGGLD